MADYTYAFDSGVYDTTKMGNPAPINADTDDKGRGGTFPLSAANNSFQLVSAGKINHENVEGVLFNYSAAASSAPMDADFLLQSPGGPDHPDRPATATISLSAAPGDFAVSDHSYMALSATSGNLSTFYAMASGVAVDNTGAADIVGSVFYSCTGTDTQALQALTDVINNLGTDGAFKATIIKHLGQVQIEQRLGGVGGNSRTPLVSAAGVTHPLSSVIVVDSNFQGGADEQRDATVIRAAGRTGAHATPGYDGAQVAVVTETGRTVLYTLNHYGTTNPTGWAGGKPLSGFNLATGPNMRREVLMGYR